VTAARYRREPDVLDRIIAMNSPSYARVRAACCPFHGFANERELDRHAAAVVYTVSQLRNDNETGRAGSFLAESADAARRCNSR
jgi:hypothetical protein